MIGAAIAPKIAQRMTLLRVAVGLVLSRSLRNANAVILRTLHVSELSQVIGISFSAGLSFFIDS